MEELEALQRLQRKEERALLWFIERYSAYVTAIFRRMLGASATAADLEELASDVFFILWSKAAAIEAGKVKAYLGSVARNKARDFLRRRDGSLPLEEDVLLISPETPQQTLEARELAACLRAALDAMDDPEREIFYRHYQDLQPISEIAAALELNPSTVKTKLHRGRKKLKEALRTGGYTVEDANF